MLALALRHLQRVRARLARVPNRQALVRNGLTIGKNTFLGQDVLIDPQFAWLISVGDNTTIAPRTVVLAHDASTKQHLGYTRIAPVAIGSDVYVGVSAIILPGVSIGDRAVIGAGSVVTHDVEPGQVVAGNPARAICTTNQFVERNDPLLKEWMAAVTNAGVTTEELRPHAQAIVGNEVLRTYLRSGQRGFVR